MSSRLRIGIIVAVLGIILIILGGFVVFRLYQQTLETPEQEVVVEEVVTVDVLVASRDLEIGHKLTQEDLEIVSIPVEFSTRGAVTDAAEAVDKTLKVDLIQGEMILSHNLAQPTASVHDVAYVLSETHVLFALPATDLMSRESMVRTGDIIDVFATVRTTIETVDENENRTETTETVTFNSMQRLGVTAMVVDIITEEGTVQAEGEEEAEAQPRQRKVIKAYLLALDPQDALILKYLKDVNAIFDIVLRAPTSTGQFNVTPVTQEYLKELYGLEILP